jgi:hypothetical protein
MPEPRSVQDEGLFSDATLQDWICGEIHRFLHVEKAMSRQQLADAAGISVDMLDAIRKTGEGRRKHGPAAMLCLCLVMGERRVNGLLAFIGYAGAKPLDEAGIANVRDIIANILPHLTTIAGAAKDGIIDHTEEPDTTRAADRIILEVLPLSSAGKAR